MELSNLNLSAFSVNSGNLLGVLKTGGKLSVKNDEVDARAINERYPFFLETKQLQSYDFTVFSLNSLGVPSTNLDISLWDMGGEALLGQLRGGTINVTTNTSERSSIASFNKLPNPQSTPFEVTSDLLVSNSAYWTNLNIAPGSQSNLAVSVAIAFGLESFVAPCVLSGTVLSIDRDAMQMENVTLHAQGTPTGPNDSSLLGLILLGSAAVTLALDTGGNTYSVASGVITALRTQFSEATTIEQTGTIVVQGTSTIGGA